MVTATEDVLSRIHETHILLNSNMLDAQDAAKEAKAVSQEVLVGLGSLEKETEENISKVKSELRDQLQNLENDLNKEMNVLTNKSLQKMTKDNAELKDTTKSSSEEIQKSIQRFQQHQDQQYQTFQKALALQALEQKELILEVQKNLFAQIDVSFANQEKLSGKISDLKKTLKELNEAHLKKAYEENQSLKKFQKKWYITTFIAILISYFL
ncbi:hypothetical protein [Neobacillus citreus]|uniref:Uncharacterized protein n=1 Tax=Neobacillus citreus TaxID=2833578 RepID=A0A942YE60_9BACI|nr:hypothetical protein [Neobacillus citreus]MCH6267000.1 hypothetical protein [Neobacillus citreus]